jgi:hypothetical protein
VRSRPKGPVQLSVQLIRVNQVKAETLVLANALAEKLPQIGRVSGPAVDHPLQASIFKLTLEAIDQTAAKVLAPAQSLG